MFVRFQPHCLKLTVRASFHLYWLDLLTNIQFHDTPDSEFLHIDVVVSWRYAIYGLGFFLGVVFVMYRIGAAIVRLVYGFDNHYECYSYCHSPLWL